LAALELLIKADADVNKAMKVRAQNNKEKKKKEEGIPTHNHHHIKMTEIAQDGWTPVLLAAYNGSVSLINVLINGGADMSKALPVRAIHTLPVPISCNHKLSLNAFP